MQGNRHSGDPPTDVSRAIGEKEVGKNLSFWFEWINGLLDHIIIYRVMNINDVKNVQWYESICLVFWTAVSVHH